jgi:hypothetical protein
VQYRLLELSIKADLGCSRLSIGAPGRSLDRSRCGVTKWGRPLSRATWCATFSIRERSRSISSNT